MKFENLAIITAGIVVLTGTPAMADTPGGDTLTVDLSAAIAQRCGIAPSGSSSLSGASLDRAESHAFDFAIDCNTPFAIGVRSSSGGLSLAASGTLDTAGDGFSTLKPYSVALELQTDNGPMSGGKCGSAALTAAGSCAFYGASSGEGLGSGQRTAIRRTGSMTIAWSAGEDEARRAAGTYRDTLTIIVGPRT